MTHTVGVCQAQERDLDIAEASSTNPAPHATFPPNSSPSLIKLNLAHVLGFEIMERPSRLRIFQKNQS